MSSENSLQHHSLFHVRVVAHREKLQNLRLQIRCFLGRSATGWVCLGPGGPLSSGTLWRRGCVRRFAHRAGITSFSGRSVKLRRQVEGQHPHTMQRPTSAHHRRSLSLSLPTISLDPPPLPPARLPSPFLLDPF